MKEKKETPTKSKKNWWDNVSIGSLHPGPNVVKKEDNNDNLEEKVLVSSKEAN